MQRPEMTGYMIRGAEITGTEPVNSVNAPQKLGQEPKEWEV